MIRAFLMPQVSVDAAVDAIARGEGQRAAIAAAINAWPEMHVWDAKQVWHHPSIVLPLQRRRRSHDRNFHLPPSRLHRWPRAVRGDPVVFDPS